MSISPPSHWQPSDKCRVAVRKIAVDILSAVFYSRATKLEGECPSFIVTNNALVNVSTLTDMGESITSCPHCARVHSASPSKVFGDDGELMDNPETVPKYVYVGVTIRVPVSLLPNELQASDVPATTTPDLASIKSMMEA